MRGRNGVSMSYAIAAQKLRELPEESLDELIEYIDFLQFRGKKAAERTSGSGFSRFFGTVKTLDDGMEIQRRMRDE